MLTQGVLPCQEISRLISQGIINDPNGVSDSKIQPASLDLYLDRDLYLIGKRVSKDSVEELIRNSRDKINLEERIDLSNLNFHWLAKLKESLALSQEIEAYSNPKSTTGRSGKHVRLLTEENEPRYDVVPEGYNGDLYLLISPKIFTGSIKMGDSLNQLKFFRGDTDLTETALRTVHYGNPLLYYPDGIPVENNKIKIDKFGTNRAGIVLSIDCKYGDENNIVAWRSKKKVKGKIEMYNGRKPEEERLDWNEFWTPIFASKKGKISIEKGYFYILSSFECIKVHPYLSCTVAVSDPSYGEYRSHYAGFCDPGFGTAYFRRKADNKLVELEELSKGSQVTFELLAQEPRTFKHRESIGRVVFDLMAEIPSYIYGEVPEDKVDEIKNQRYNLQRGPKLAKYFKSYKI